MQSGCGSVAATGRNGCGVGSAEGGGGLGWRGIRGVEPDEILRAVEQAKKMIVEHRVPVVVEVILERVTNVSMGLDIDNVTEFEDLVGDDASDAPTALFANLD